MCTSTPTMRLYGLVLSSSAGTTLPFTFTYGLLVGLFPSSSLFSSFSFFRMPSSGVGFFLFTYGFFRHLVGLLERGISPAPRPLLTQDNTTRRNTDTSMPRAGFEPAIPMAARSKTVPALERAAIETDPVPNTCKCIFLVQNSVRKGRLNDGGSVI
jgi:hypothetical protein